MSMSVAVPAATADACEPLIRLRGVARAYPTPAGPCHALVDIELEVAAGQFVAVVGASGSGKSTLLHLLGGLDRPERGEVQVAGQRLDTLREAQLSCWRAQAVGFVFQFFQLLPTLTALENVQLPMDLARHWPKHERRARALALLERLGVAEQAEKLPATLSGGQQQRVALARALANAPALLLADEPTGNLDSRNAAQLLALFAELARDGHTIVMVTHERAAMQAAMRSVTLADGRIVADTRGGA